MLLHFEGYKRFQPFLYRSAYPDNKKKHYFSRLADYFLKNKNKKKKTRKKLCFYQFV